MRRSSCLLALFGALVAVAAATPPAHAEVTHPFLSSFDGSDTPSGTFGAAARIGVDQSNGNVYVVDISNVFAGTGAVEVFDASGTFLHEITGEDTPAGALRLSRPARTALARARLPVTVVVGSSGADRRRTARVTLRKRAR